MDLEPCIVIILGEERQDLTWLVVKFTDFFNVSCSEHVLYLSFWCVSLLIWSIICRDVKERLLRLGSNPLMSCWKSVSCVYHGLLFTLNDLKMCNVGLPCLKVVDNTDPPFLSLFDLITCKLYSAELCYCYLYLCALAIKLMVKWQIMAGSLPGTDDPVLQREKLYLLAIGHYRSGDYSRSRDLVERCLMVLSSLFLLILAFLWKDLNRSLKPFNFLTSWLLPQQLYHTDFTCSFCWKNHNCVCFMPLIEALFP